MDMAGGAVEVEAEAEVEVVVVVVPGRKEGGDERRWAGAKEVYMEGGRGVHSASCNCTA